MAARHRNRNAPALANLDAIIELASPYGIAGSRASALDLQRSRPNRAVARSQQEPVTPVARS